MADFYPPLGDKRGLPTYGKIVSCFHYLGVGRATILKTELEFNGKNYPPTLCSLIQGEAPAVTLMGGADAVK